MPVRNKMIKAREAYEKVSALLDEQALVECEKIGVAIEKAAKNGATSLAWSVEPKLNIRIGKMLRDHGYAVVSTSGLDSCYDDNGKMPIEINWYH